jgi:hypothetical protein
LNTGEDFYAFAFIFQHGETADDYLFVHVLAVDAACTFRERAVRRFMGRKEQPYDDAFLTDSLRPIFCIASRDQ